MTASTTVAEKRDEILKLAQAIAAVNRCTKWTRADQSAWEALIERIEKRADRE